MNPSTVLPMAKGFNLPDQPFSCDSDSQAN